MGDEEKKPETEDITKRKWLEVRFSLELWPQELRFWKDIFKSYLEELDGWEIVREKGEVTSDGDIPIWLKLQPIGGKMSPEEYREQFQLIQGFCIDIVEEWNDLIEDEYPERVFSNVWQGVSDYEEVNNGGDLKYYRKLGLFNLNCKVTDRLELDKKHPDFGRFIFDYTFKEYYNQWKPSLTDKIFRKNDTKYWMKMLQDFSNWYGLKFDALN